MLHLKNSDAVQQLKSFPFPLFDLKSSRGNRLKRKNLLTQGEILGCARFEKYIYPGGVVVALLTYATCFTITKVNNVYTFDLWFPFFSDIGRQGPQYYVFASGLTTAAIFIVVGHFYVYRKVLSRKLQDRMLNSEIESRKFHDLKWLIWIARLASFFGMLSAPFLVIAGIYDAARHPYLHIYWGAYPFFGLGVFAMFFYSIVYYQFAKVEQLDRTKYPWSKAMNQSGRLKYIIFSIFTVAFAFYLPIGMQFTKKWRDLTVHECQARLGMTLEQCEMFLMKPQPTDYPWNWRNPDLASLDNDDPAKWAVGAMKFDEHRTWDELPPITMLYSYDNTLEWGHIRSVCQAICLICILLFSGSFYWEMKDEERLRKEAVSVNWR